MTDARVLLWGRDIGAVSWLQERARAVFQYTPEFAQSGIQVAPIMMPLSTTPYEFPMLSNSSFNGLPGLLADSLPDKFGHALIDAWLVRQNREPQEFNPVERLCYIGSRGMGGLEFKPSQFRHDSGQNPLDVAALVELANHILNKRQALAGRLRSDDAADLEQIIRVGTSAGGARAKAVLAWNPQTGEFRSGQVDSGPGFSHWLMKFDGIDNNRDKELADPQGYGLIEYVYYRMARQAGIVMQNSRLHRENGRAHFMTQRFDRTDRGGKYHMQSLSAMMHFDFNQPGAYSYEQAIHTLRRLNAPRPDIEQQFRRAVFNVLGRNQDDHVKNIAYLMDKGGRWRLAPAFDLAYAYNPSGLWTSNHQMSVNGKRRGFDLDDILALANASDIKTAPAKRIVSDCQQALANWPQLAAEHGIDSLTIDKIADAHRRLI